MKCEIYDLVSSAWNKVPSDHLGFWDGVNQSLSRKLIRRDLTDIVLLLRDGKTQFISNENWNLIADILEKKRKPKEKQNNYFRDQLITLKVMELRALGYNIMTQPQDKLAPTAIEKARNDIAKGMECHLGVETIRDIYYENISGFSEQTVGEIRSRGSAMQQAAKDIMKFANPIVESWQIF